MSMTDTAIPADDDLFVPAIPDDDDQANDQAAGDDEGEFEIILDGEDPEAGDDTKAPSWVKGLRQQNREQARELAELRAQAGAQRVELPPKPTLEGCDYDGDKFEAALDQWKDLERQSKESQTQAQRQQEEAKNQFVADLDRLKAGEQALRAPDYTSARDDVVAAMDDAQQAVIVTVAKDAAKVIYAIGKRPERLAQLAAIKNPLKLAAAIADLERGMKVTTRRKAPEPETIARGSAPLAKPGADKQLARLEAEADRTGDRTKVVQYKRQQRANQK